MVGCCWPVTWCHVGLRCAVQILVNSVVLALYGSFRVIVYIFLEALRAEESRVRGAPPPSVWRSESIASFSNEQLLPSRHVRAVTASPQRCSFITTVLINWR